METCEIKMSTNNMLFFFGACIIIMSTEKEG